MTKGLLRGPLRGNTADRPGYALETAYRQAREQHARMRWERLSHAVPRAALRAFPFALFFAVLAATGLNLPTVVALSVYLLIQLGWPLIVIGKSFDPVPEIEALREGAESERQTARTINRLRRHGYVIMHDRHVPHSEATIGHLLVGPGGVMVIKSDPSPGTVRYGKDGAKVDGQSLKKPLDLTKWLGDEVRSQTRTTMPMIKIPVTPILVMVEAGVLWSDGAVDGVTLISLKDLVSYVRARPDRLSPAEVTKVVATVQRLFPVYSTDRSADHVIVDRDQWLTLVDTLRTIRERGDDATDMLDRLAQVENELRRLAETSGRSGIPAARTDGGTDGEDGDLVNELMGADATPVRLTGGLPDNRRRGRILSSVRPLRLPSTRAPRDTGDQAGEPPDSEGPSNA